MSFSQEIKVEAYRRGFRCAEVPIDYYPRGGTKKIRTVRDGVYNFGQLFAYRLRARSPANARRTAFSTTCSDGHVGGQRVKRGRGVAATALDTSIAATDPARQLAQRPPIPYQQVDL
jgi:hypothetical protein